FFLKKGAVRGEPILSGNRVVGYLRPPAISPMMAKPRAEIADAAPPAGRLPDAPEETRVSPPMQPEKSTPVEAEKHSMESLCSNLPGPAARELCLARQIALT